VLQGCNQVVRGKQSLAKAYPCNLVLLGNDVVFSFKEELECGIRGVIMDNRKTDIGFKEEGKSG
jgi:hypothetical protein